VIADPAAVQRLCYNWSDACKALGVSRTTLWCLEKLGLIKPVPSIRHKLYSVEMLTRFVAGDRAEGRR
jgi:hypothetical protein